LRQNSARRPSISSLPAISIRGYETFTLDDHIRAKPDVIHYVDSPKIYRQEKAEPKSTNIKAEARSSSSLYWHQDTSNKFVVKRNPGPFSLNQDSTSTSTSTTTSSPLVKIVRYDPQSDEDYSSKIISRNKKINGIIRSQVARQQSTSTEQSQTKYLPVQVGDKRFPLPQTDQLDGKTVKSVVLVVPHNYKLWQHCEGHSPPELLRTLTMDQTDLICDWWMGDPVLCPTVRMFKEWK